MMQPTRLLWLPLALAFTLLSFSRCDDLDDVTPGLSDEEVVAGLKEALEVGADSTTTRLHKTDGYFKNELIKILLPPEAQEAEQLIRDNVPGGDALLQDVVLEMNRAAEAAADDAKPIFFDAIKNLTINDGLTILQGSDTAATNLLRGRTRPELFTTFKPKIQTAMEDVGLQQTWDDLSSTYNNTVLPAISITNPDAEPLPTDISEHVTDEALVGLFVVVGQEEQKIRTDVNARVTDLLKRVFAKQD